MKITQKRPIRVSLLFPALIFALAAAQPLYALSPALPSVNDDSAYATGTRAMNDHRWQDAILSFDRVIDSKDKRADAALYWKAYSLQKIGRGPLAVATCYQLRSQYTSSSWNKDCSALSIDTHANQDDLRVPPVPPVPPVAPEAFEGPSVPGSAPRGSDEDLKILALNSLLNQDPARAIPMLRGILSGNQSMNVKKHALFVLAQSRSPEAESALHDAVIGKMDPELQRQAVQSIAIFQGKRANDTLVEVYRSSSDLKLKRSIITSIFITQDAPRLVELARSEKDLDLKRYIVSQLAIMNDKASTDYMMELLK